jgi:hypothetical protein
MSNMRIIPRLDDESLKETKTIKTIDDLSITFMPRETFQSILKIVQEDKDGGLPSYLVSFLVSRVIDWEYADAKDGKLPISKESLERLWVTYGKEYLWDIYDKMLAITKEIQDLELKKTKESFNKKS